MRISDDELSCAMTTIGFSLLCTEVLTTGDSRRNSINDKDRKRKTASVFLCLTEYAVFWLKKYAK